MAVDLGKVLSCSLCEFVDHMLNLGSQI